MERLTKESVLMSAKNHVYSFRDLGLSTEVRACPCRSASLLLITTFLGSNIVLIVGATLPVRFCV
jgi:hypothetical protein